MENFIFNHRGLSIRAEPCGLVSERNMVVSNGVIYSMESIVCLLKFRRIQDLLQCGDFIVELGHGWQKAKRFQQRHTDTQRKTQHQNQIGQSRPAAEDKPCTHRQGQDNGTRKQAAVNRHPRPCRLIPCQRIVPIIRYIFAEPFVRICVFIENFDDFHTVDVLNNGIIHFLPGHIVRSHFLHADGIHRHHGN